MSTTTQDEADEGVNVAQLATRLTKYRYQSSPGVPSSSSSAGGHSRIVNRAPPSPPVTPIKRELDSPTRVTRSHSGRQPPKSRYFDGAGSSSSDDEFKPSPHDAEDPVNPSPSKKRKKKPSRPYADPSLYAHLGGLTDILDDNLDVMICGINPGLQSAATHTHYAHPTNHFWKSLWKSGVTDRLYAPREGQLLLETAKMGLTNLVARPTAETSELSAKEKFESVPVFLAKVIRFKPKVVAFTGMEICDVTMKYLHLLPNVFKLSNSPPAATTDRLPAIPPTNYNAK
ncbi:uracil DNA N-glycosylase Thp1 [Microbotryomycetes sp. JL201]|nr:uracil DNA N-glycosylase Thp1 [Microbotryomycetes sp. JL201]